MSFRELLESNRYNINDDFMEFIDALYNYMDLYDKTSVSKIIKLGSSLGLFEKRSKVYRITCNSDLGDFKLVSCSTSVLKGKTLDGVITDMKDRYEYYKKKTCELTYLELKNVEGIDITKLSKFILDNKNQFEDYVVDMFKRLKTEKEFLTINKNINVSKIEK